MQIAVRALLIVQLLFLFSCKVKQEGTIEGTVAPPGMTATVNALRDNRVVTSVQTAADGRFTLVLAPGIYRIAANAAGSAASRAIDNVIVRPGETIFLPAIDLAVRAGKAVLAGRVLASRPGSEVVLIDAGIERAAVRTDSEGRFELRELPAGSYEVRAKLAGHAEDSAPVVLPAEGTVSQNILLLPITSIEGVDWAAGKIRATGVGVPPPNAQNQTVRRALAQRAALSDGQRNLLRIVERIRLDGARTVKDAMASGAITVRVQGLLQGSRVISERELEQGRIEVVLELPLSGPAGLSRALAE